ncbi:MAG: hypothetical protein ACQESF_02895 [Nanobdellota archaeon]
MMRGLRLTVLLLILSLVLGGCSLFVTEDSQEGKVCIPKEKLEEIDITVDQLLDKLQNMTEQQNATTEDSANESTSVEDSEEGSLADSEEKDSTEDTSEEEKDSTEEMSVKEYTAGEMVEITPEAAEDLEFEFSEPLDESGQWQTTSEDVGEYVVDVTATNAAGASVTKQVKIVVKSGNEAPVINGLSDVSVEAGEVVKLSPEVSDADGDEVTISYSGWMGSSEKNTTKEDVGTHEVAVVADDGKTTTEKTVQVTVVEKNNPPTIEEISKLTFTEGDLVKVEPKADDVDGDEVTLSYSEPFDENGEWQTQTGDAGTYSVTITATDGELEAKESFSIIVEKANTAPEIVYDELVEFYVTEGESKTIELSPEVSDADGDEVTVSYSGWMDSSTKEVTAEDKGEHSVTITATDGKAQSSHEVVVKINVNSPPEFTL